MKVKINITIDVDAEAWTANYGVEGSAEIRADVQAYAVQVIESHFGDDLGVLSPRRLR